MTPKRSIIPLFVPHAGCKNTCVFCDQRQITGKTTPVTAKDVAETVSKALNLIKTDSVTEIAFFGGSFTAVPISKQNELLEAAQPFLSLNKQNSIRISTRPDCLTAEDAVRLRSYGVKTIELGVQSLCDDVLIASERGHTSKDVFVAVETVKSAGLELVLQMMTGLPGDTNEKSVETARKFIKLEPNAVRIYPTVIVKGTKLHEMWMRGEYTEHDLTGAIELCARICELFWETDIPIIRLGLNPTKEFAMGAAVAGAYHPAFGELVYSRIYYKRASALLRKENIPVESDVILEVPRGHTSMMAGYCRRNVSALRKEFALRSLKIKETDAPRGWVSIVGCGFPDAPP